MRRRGVFLVAVALLVGCVGTACKGSEQLSSFTTTTQKARVVEQSVDVAPTPGIPEPTKIALAARATGGAVTIFSSPDAATKPLLTLSNPTIEAQPLAFLAVDQQGEWLQVRMPERPNGTMGWIRANQVSLTPVENRIVISVGSRMLRVFDKNQAVLYETNVAVGKPATPTPLGRFYVDIWLPRPGSPYGAFLLSISGFSEVLRTFGGGRGQIAMHGWSDPSVMGRNVSNGCVRMRNADISHVASLAPLGTPVEIVA